MNSSLVIFCGLYLIPLDADTSSLWENGSFYSAWLLFLGVRSHFLHTYGIFWSVHTAPFRLQNFEILALFHFRDLATLIRIRISQRAFNITILLRPRATRIRARFFPASNPTSKRPRISTRKWVQHTGQF